MHAWRPTDVGALEGDASISDGICNGDVSSVEGGEDASDDNVGSILDTGGRRGGGVSDGYLEEVAAVGDIFIVGAPLPSSGTPENRSSCTSWFNEIITFHISGIYEHISTHIYGMVNQFQRIHDMIGALPNAAATANATINMAQFLRYGTRNST